MADIFQGLPVGPSTWTKDDGSLGRSFIAGMEIGNQRRQQALREAEFRRQIDPNSPQNQLVAAQIIQDNIRNDLAKQQIAHSVSAEAYFANLARNPPQPEELLNQAWTPTGNPMIDGPMEKMRNDAATKILMKNNSVWRQQTILEGSKLLGANPNDYPDFMNSFDPNGNPTKATTDILTRNKDVISKWEQEQARLKPGVIAAETRGQYSIARQEMADEARKDLQSLKLSADSSAIHSKGLTFANHLQLNQFKLEADLIKQLPLKKQDKAKMEFDNRWKQIWQQAEQDSNQPASPQTGTATPATKGIQLKDKKTGQIFNYGGNAADVPTDRYDILSQ